VYLGSPALPFPVWPLLNRSVDRWLLAVDTNGGATEPDENPLSELAKLEQRLLWLQTEIQTVQNQINDIKKHVPKAPKTGSAPNRAA
jgi:hypothetical protein